MTVRGDFTVDADRAPRNSSRRQEGTVEVVGWTSSRVPAIRRRYGFACWADFRSPLAAPRSMEMPGSSSARTLIKLLALAPGHRLHREQVIDALWGEHVPADPPNSLYQVVRAARLAIATAQPEAGVWLAFEGEQLLLSAPSSAAAGYDMTDVEAFEAAASQAVQVGSVAAYRTAIAIYAGDLLPEDRYAEWAATRRARLSTQFIDLLLGLARTLEAQQAHAEAIETLRRVVLDDPAHEEARVRLMRLHALRGAPGEAEREYVALAAALAEIGARPGRMSQQLRADIHGGRFPVARPGASPSLLEEASTAAAPGTLATNLPFDTSRFIGRSREAGEVVGLLAEARLVTVTGVGGGGKTRLALHVARSLVGRYRDGVWLVELAALGQPSLVAQATAAALRMPERGGTSAMESLIAALDGKQLLLVLDNCEHLIEACAHLVEALLRRCPAAALPCCGAALLRRCPAAALPSSIGGEHECPPDAPPSNTDRAALRRIFT
jgi:DNA-binding SARP family transcriptional activator